MSASESGHRRMAELVYQQLRTLVTDRVRIRHQHEDRQTALALTIPQSLLVRANSFDSSEGSDTKPVSLGGGDPKRPD